jgi:subtilisin family serine protease
MNGNKRLAGGPYDHYLAGAAAADLPEPGVDIADLDARDVVEIARDPQVAAVAPVIPISLIAPVESDTVAAENAWGIAAIGADTTPFTGEGVVVAVLDTGIDRSHRAFASVTMTEVDFTGTGNGDGRGHGTHCAGTIFGRDVDGYRIGVARGITHALIGKVLDSEGRGTSDMIFRSMAWALEQGADVISMSLGFDFPGYTARLTKAGWPVELASSSALVAYRANLRVFDSLMRMIQVRAVMSGGPVVIAAAGNESKTDIRPDFKIAASLPAAAEGVISVGALEIAGDQIVMAAFSNTFPEISAPGVAILSARVGGGVVANSGTSMACPHVAGAAALWWEAVRKSGQVRASPEMVKARIITGARTDRFAPHVAIADRGSGMVIAPQ